MPSNHTGLEFSFSDKYVVKILHISSTVLRRALLLSFFNYMMRIYLNEKSNGKHFSRILWLVEFKNFSSWSEELMNKTRGFPRCKYPIATIKHWIRPVNLPAVEIMCKWWNVGMAAVSNRHLLQIFIVPFDSIHSAHWWLSRMWPLTVLLPNHTRSLLLSVANYNRSKQAINKGTQAWRLSFC